MSLQWFRNGVEAKADIEAWRRHYNDVRPHSSMNYRTLSEFKVTQLSITDDGGRSLALPARAAQEEHEDGPPSRGPSSFE